MTCAEGKENNTWKQRSGGRAGPRAGPHRQRFCAGALFHVFARRLAYIFTSLQSLMPTFSRLCIHATRVIIMWAIHYRPPKLKSIPITRSAEKPSSTMANLPARHRPNTSPAPSNCFQPSPKYIFEISRAF